MNRSPATKDRTQRFQSCIDHVFVHYRPELKAFTLPDLDLWEGVVRMVASILNLPSYRISKRHRPKTITPEQLAKFIAFVLMSSISPVNSQRHQGFLGTTPQKACIAALGRKVCDEHSYKCMFEYCISVGLLELYAPHVPPMFDPVTGRKIKGIGRTIIAGKLLGNRKEEWLQFINDNLYRERESSAWPLISSRAVPSAASLNDGGMRRARSLARGRSRRLWSQEYQATFR